MSLYYVNLRYFRSIKKLIMLYATDNPESSWKDVLEKVQEIVNHRFNRSIGMSPVETIAKWHTVQEKNSKMHVRMSFPEYVQEQKQIAKGKKVKDGNMYFYINQNVLIPYKSSAMDKESDRQYSYRIYKIKHIFNEEIPYMYKLMTQDKETLPELYYGKQLKPVKEPDFYPVDRILKEKKVGRQKYFLTKFLDYPESEAVWIKQDNFKKIQK